MKKILMLIISAVMVFNFIAVGAIEEESDVIITALEVSEGGEVMISGYIDADTKFATLLVYEKGAKMSTLTGEQIAYIDQIELGEGNAFLFKFRLNARWSEQKLDFKIGGCGVPLMRELTAPEISATFDTITDNSVVYGCDVYKVGTKHLTSKNVADSVVKGGHVIYFKLGGMWFDLTSSEATSSEYLTEENAVNESEVKTLDMRYYYVYSNKVEFEE